MSKLVSVKIAHQLGRAEATRRIKQGGAKARANFERYVSSIDETWNGDHLDFRVVAMGQTVSGTLDVFDDHVLAEFELPALLAYFANKIKGTVEQQGTLMLEHKKPGDTKPT